MIAHSRFNVVHLPPINQIYPLAASPANRAAGAPDFLLLHYTGNARAKLWGKKGHRLTQGI
jgi:hypothetical protein